MTTDSRSPLDLWALTNLQTPWCIHVVVTLDIPVFTATEPRTINQIAVYSASDPVMLLSLLRHLVAVGVFIEPENALFQLSPYARELTEPAAKLGLDLNGIGGRMAGAWETLLTAVRTG